VIGAGTGGTITGVAKRLKELNPNIIVVGVDPIGSILAEPEELNVPGPSYLVEGIGYDFIPDVLHRECIDQWIKSNDADSFQVARELIKKEGLFCGGSSGTAMWAALQAAKQLKKGQTCVVILPDSIRNYMSKHLRDTWLADKGFLMQPHTVTWWSEKTLADLKLPTPVTVTEDAAIGDVLALMQSKNFDQLPVTSGAGVFLGVVTEGSISTAVLKGASPTDLVSRALFKQYKTCKMNAPLHELSTHFETVYFVVVLQEHQGKNTVAGVATRIDLTNYIIANAPKSTTASSSSTKASSSSTKASSSSAPASSSSSSAPASASSTKASHS